MGAQGTGLRMQYGAHTGQKVRLTSITFQSPGVSVRFVSSLPIGVCVVVTWDHNPPSLTHADSRRAVPPLSDPPANRQECPSKGSSNLPIGYVSTRRAVTPSSWKVVTSHAPGPSLCGIGRKKVRTALRVCAARARRLQPKRRKVGNLLLGPLPVLDVGRFCLYR